MIQKAVTETIRICKDRNVLREYLAQREKEVVTIMMSLFDEEQIMKSFIKSERHDADRETAERLIKKGKMTLEDIAECVPSLSFDELKELEAEIMQLLFTPGPCTALYGRGPVQYRGWNPVFCRKATLIYRFF